jgi:hypothetical protein
MQTDDSLEDALFYSWLSTIVRKPVVIIYELLYQLWRRLLWRFPRYLEG